MIKEFIQTFKLKTTYEVNSVLYSLKQMPIIKHIIPYDIYKITVFKVIGNIINVIKEFIKTSIGKMIYILLMILVPCFIFNTSPTNAFLNIFVFLTLIGGLINTPVFTPSREKYYAIRLLRMNAKKYAISEYIIEFIKILIGYLPLLLLIKLVTKMPGIIVLSLPLFVILTKCIFIYKSIYKYNKSGTYVIKPFDNFINYILVAILLLGAYALPIFKIAINLIIYIILFIIVLITSLYSIKKIFAFDGYNRIFRSILTEENIKNSKIIETEKTKELASDNIEYSEPVNTSKKGYAFFHELFEKRHSKILSKAIKKQTIGILIVFAVLIGLLIFFPQSKQDVNDIVLNMLPYFLLLMYYLNRGTILTQAMFMNCDHSMLTYRIFRTKKVILGLFKERLKTLIKYNIIPATIMGVGMSLLLLISGGTNNPINYFVITISIISMSIFFSIHYLVLYYLLQPYNAQTEVKSSTYHTVQGFTYFVIYMLADVSIPSFYFGITMIIFTIIYSILSLVIVYVVAPKTFKLRV